MHRDPLLDSRSPLGTKSAPQAEPRWYACCTRARAEKQVDRLLARVGFETYLPVVELERAWADRTKRVLFPLFPGYTFARLSPDRLVDVVRTPGVVELVGGMARPTPVRDEELEAVRRLASGAAALEQAPELVDWLEPGTPVEVTEGPFRGMRGLLVQVRGSARVAVRLTAIRMAAAVELNPGSVRKVA
jgi:transcription antitermination factor NusG